MVTQGPVKNTFNGNGVTVAFSTDFQAFDADSITVTLTTGGVDTVATGWSVIDLRETDGFTVTLLAAPATGTTVTIERLTELVQPSDTSESSDSMPTEVIEAGLDRLTLAVQEDRARMDALDLVVLDSGLFVPITPRNLADGPILSSDRMVFITQDLDVVLLDVAPPRQFLIIKNMFNGSVNVTPKAGTTLDAVTSPIPLEYRDSITLFSTNGTAWFLV
jgi:hypothetical protein